MSRGTAWTSAGKGGARVTMATMSGSDLENFILLRRESVGLLSQEERIVGKYKMKVQQGHAQ
jgi:hypothetical protein